ncbi:subtilisin-like protein [Whalleya microplaca]|nr:subtilisin-like protein [Whalleya microplaca]
MCVYVRNMLGFLTLMLLVVRISAMRIPRFVDGAFIIELSREVAVTDFLQRGIYVGLSIRVSGHGDHEIISTHLNEIPGVVSVSPVYEMVLSNSTARDDWTISADPFLSYPDPPAPPEVTPKPGEKLTSTLGMAGIDKLHELGIKGNGIKIGIIDTGIDYRHPALGGGYGPGHKIAGGWSWLSDNGTAVENDDFLTTCYGGGHGTHVAGIIGMDSLPDSGRMLNISGVAPEATLYIYKVFDCSLSGGMTDRVIAAMLRAHSDGVDMISMSLSIQESWQSGTDPLTTVAASLADAGVAVIVAQGNAGSDNKFSPQLYRTSTPAELPTIISVGSIANKYFPLVYILTDSQGTTIPYAALWPIEVSDGSEGKLNSTIIAFSITDSCRYTDASKCCTTGSPPFLLGLNTGTSNSYHVDYEIASSGFFGDGSVQYISVNANDSVVLLANLEAVGGDQYRLFFNDSSYSSSPQFVGGKMDYYSSFGPSYLTYDLKPQISAPDGHILSTWPLGKQGFYTILSGTSMATPFLSGCYALVKSQFLELSVAEIFMIAGTFHQGAGLVNAFDAIMYQSRVSPGQILISDNSRTTYGAGNITIENRSNLPKIYTLSHEGASYSEPNPPNNPIFMQENQLPIYGSVEFEPSTVELAAGTSVAVAFRILPPSSGVKPSELPVFGGFVKVTVSDGEELSVPYSGPPYSLYNAQYFSVLNTTPSNVQPRLAYNFSDGWWIDTSLYEVNASLSYRSVIGLEQFTRGFRVDIVPANISITPDLYGFDPAETHDYQPSETVPPVSVLGFPSYGTLRNSTVLRSPSTFDWPSGTGLTATFPNGTIYIPGPGDYRWLASVLRWGGDPSSLEDHQTWLSAVIRFVNGPVDTPIEGTKGG